MKTFLFLIGCVLAQGVLAANSIVDDDDDFEVTNDDAIVVKMSRPPSPPPSEHPLTRAIEVIELVSKLSSDTSHAIQFISTSISKSTTTDPLTFVSTIAVYGFIKAVSLLVSGFLYVSSLIAPNSAASIPMLDLYSLQNIDYNIVSNSISSVPEKSFRLFDIRDEECKSRAMCEVGEMVRRYLPQIGVYVRLATERLDLKDIYTAAMLRGIGWTDCDSAYGQCGKSPFKKFHRIINSIGKLLQN